MMQRLLSFYTAVAATILSFVMFKVLNKATDEQTLPVYKYEALQGNRSTRVFILLPAWSFNAPVRGFLAEVSLDSDPVYEGLSYLCGDPVPGHDVQITTTSSDHTRDVFRLPVYPNCLTALRVLRHRFKSRTLWVDAISIDQGPTQEKSQQVKMMTEIYRKAKRVLIVLRPEAEHNGQVKQVAWLFWVTGWLYRLGLLRAYDRDEQTNNRMPKATKIVMACDRFVESRSKQLGDAFNAPFFNRYFKRVWTVQEIAMARDIQVHYGTSVIAWQDFVVSALFTVKRGGFAKNQQSSIDVFRDSAIHWDLLNGLESHFVLPDIYGLKALGDRKPSHNTLDKFGRGTSELALIKSKGLQAFEPKDKAYAMLWAFGEIDRDLGSLLEVDYQKPLEYIYTEFSTAIFVRTSGSSLQFYLVNSVPRNAALLSWVPDWSVTSPMSFFVWCERLRDFSAAGDDSRHHRLSINGPVLHISGSKVSDMRAFLRLSETARKRDLYSGSTEELIEALIDAAELIRSLIEVGTSHASYNGKEALLQAVHRVIHSQLASHEGTADDDQVFHPTLHEVEVSQQQLISVGLLRIQVFDKLKFLLDEQTLPHERVRQSLLPLLSAAQIDEALHKAGSVPHLTPLLAVISAISKDFNVYHFLHLIVLDHQDKDLFITDEGVFGMAFQGLKAGDFIALWQGCPSPMVMRPLSNAEDGSELFQLHGPAFVDGIMMGERWPTDKTKLMNFNVI